MTVRRVLSLALLAGVLAVPAARAAELDRTAVAVNDEETVIQVWSMGPATPTPAGER